MDWQPTRWFLIALLVASYAEGFAAGEAGENSEAERHLQRLMMHHAPHTGALAGLLGVTRACAYHADPRSPGDAPVMVDVDSKKMKQQPIESDTGLEAR